MFYVGINCQSSLHKIGFINYQMNYTNNYWMARKISKVNVNIDGCNVENFK